MRRTYLYIFTILFAVSAWLLTVIFSGCAFNPWPDCLQVIEGKPCISGIYECYQKSRDTSKCLKKHGYDAHATCGPIKGLKRHHCWVEINDEGKIYWYEPTWHQGCWPKSYWFDREIFKPEWNGKIKYAVGRERINGFKRE